VFMLFGIINLISANWGMRKYFNIEKKMTFRY